MKKKQNLFDAIIDNIIFITIAGFVLVSFMQVIFRYILNNSLIWAEELCRYLFVWMVFFGSAVAFKDRKHISLDLVDRVLPGWIKRYFTLILDILVIAFTIFLSVVGYQLAMKSMTQPSPAMQIPLGYIYLAIPLGAAAMCINTIRRAIADFALSHKTSDEEKRGI